MRAIARQLLSIYTDDLLTTDDDSNDIVVDSEQGPVSTKTTWTLLLYLTSQADGCQGGETVFFPNDRRVAKEEISVPPETGMVLLHKHGNDCMLVSTLPLLLDIGRLVLSLAEPTGYIIPAVKCFLSFFQLTDVDLSRSTREGKSPLGRSGSSGRISACANSGILVA